MPGERNITREQELYALTNYETLELLIKLREREAESNLGKDITVNKELCKSIGVSTYRIKNTGEKKGSYLFLINETQDGESVDIIYDKQFVYIGNKREDNQLEISREIEIDRESLERQINMANEITREASANGNNNDSSKAGDGRDLATKEHEENRKQKAENDSKENQGENKDSQEQDKTKEEKMSNLKGKVGIYNNMMIPLYEIINGHYLYDILQLEYKLEGKLPDGLTAKDFRTGFLCIVDSDELTAIDGKERNLKDRLAIRTLSGDMIELDDTILKEKSVGSRQEQYMAEQERLRYADGKEVQKPSEAVSSDLTRTALYEIPGVSDKFNVAENWCLAVDKNAEWMRSGGNRPSSGNKKEVSFVQQSRNESYYEREYNPMHTLEYKLEPTNEASLQTKEEIEQQQQLREKNPNEALIQRAEHTNEIVDKCFEKYKNLGEYYNKTDIAQKVEKYHKNMSDEEVIEQIGEDLEVAEDVEHEFHIHGDTRKH